jgi:hypothetical protein
VKTLLLILLLPVTAAAQYVDPVISKDYLDRIKDSSQPKVLFVDTANNAKNAYLILSKNYNGYKIKRIVTRHGYLKIQPAVYKMLFLSGSFNSTVELKSINQLPALQNQYVQGRSLNGVPAWQGAETNELFSYGPAINTLEFDGSNYSYDVNGKLVAAGSGNGQKANTYENNIFRTASLLSQSLTVQARYAVNGKQYVTKIKLGQSRENTFIKDNRNTSQNLSTYFEATIKGIKVSTTFSNVASRFSNSNRNGFLNRLYQNSILTPISFDNTQGNSFVNAQRSYSNAADNPFFLLENNGNSFFQSHKTGSLILEKQLSQFKFKVAQTAEKLKENSNEGYKPGTAFFQNGIIVNRKKKDANYFLNASAIYDIRFENYKLRSNVSANYIYGNTNAVIDYRTTAYKYQRSSQDLSLNYFGSYTGYTYEAGIKTENKFYASNTCLKKDFFLPGASGYIRFNNIFHTNVGLKLVSTFNNFNSELPVSTSFSQNNLTKYTAEQSFQYLPVTEISGFKGLLPVQRKEWTAKAELNYKNRILLQAEIFNRNITDDVFPVYENGAFNLKNIASHRNRGVELELTYNSYTRTTQTSHSVSFFSYKDIVTDVKDGYNFTPIAGFSNINKAIVKGKALGVIVGNIFLKDANNNVIVDSDGFPLVNATPAVIGDPTPDFIAKASSNITWKKFSMSLDWEWKKGGDVWNGTQAVLDYYGRSKTSSQLRNTTGYVFAGVFPDGHVNDIPVNFYDPAFALERNRWVRYGYTGVAEEYIQRGDHIRINNIGLSYKLTAKKYIQTVAFTLYANNIIVWTAYKGVDPNQLLYDQSDTNGLDFFNLPSVKSFGLNISIQF